jgi:hypothetical protein
MKCAKRVFQPPYVIDAIAHAYGFLSGYSKRVPRIQDRALIRYVRNQQIRRMFFMESIWK